MQYITQRATLSRCCCDSEEVWLLVPTKDWFDQILKVVNKDRSGTNYQRWREVNPDKYGQLSDAELMWESMMDNLEDLPQLFVDDAPFMVRDERQAKKLCRYLNRLDFS